jgi:branched-chain amino acid transport system substrate-binding protein
VSRTLGVVAALATALVVTLPGAAATPGVTATSILIGGTVPLSGPVSAYAPVAVGAAAYFDFVNARGGVNGRKIEYEYLDDEFNPARTVLETRRLVEEKGVLAIFNSVGTENNVAIRQYLNENGVPQLFVGSALGRDYRQYPWTMGFLPSFFAEGRLYGRYLARANPRAKIAVLYEKTIFGQQMLDGLRAGLGARKGNIVATEGTNTDDPDVTSPLSRLKGSRATVLATFVLPKQALQSFISADKLGWRPKFYVPAISIDPAVMAIARYNTQGRTTEGATSVAFLKDPSAPRWAKDATVKLYKSIMKQYGRGGSADAVAHFYGMAAAHTMVAALRKAGRDLTRESLLRAARSLNEKNPFLIPGILIKTGATDYFPIDHAQMYRFKKDRWQPIGGLTPLRD